MNSTRLIKEISDSTNLTEVAVLKVLLALSATITEKVSQGEPVMLRDLGTFQRVTRKAGTFRNPHTGETIEVGERHALKFKAYPATKAIVMGKK